MGSLMIKPKSGLSRQLSGTQPWYSQDKDSLNTALGQCAGTPYWGI